MNPALLDETDEILLHDCAGKSLWTADTLSHAPIKAEATAAAKELMESRYLCGHYHGTAFSECFLHGTSERTTQSQQCVLESHDNVSVTMARVQQMQRSTETVLGRLLFSLCKTVSC